MTYLKFSLFIALIILGTYQKSTGQVMDTLRRKDAGGWEFMQVRNFGKVTLEGNWLNGKREGVWTEFWDIGFPHVVTTYKAGKKNGLLLSTLRQGDIEFTENYKDDLLEGPRRTYKRGTGTLEEAYFSEGKKSGSYLKRYENGRPQEAANYNNDVRDGKTQWYFENGEHAADYNYNQGVIEGDVAIYSKSGNIIEFGTYHADSQTGLWKEYYETGKIKAEGYYKNGEKDGVWKQYNEDGTAGKPITYKKGVARN